MQYHGEIQETQDDGYELALGVARDLGVMLLCIGGALLPLFLARAI